MQKVICPCCKGERVFKSADYIGCSEAGKISSLDKCQFCDNGKGFVYVSDKARESGEYNGY